MEHDGAGEWVCGGGGGVHGAGHAQCDEHEPALQQDRPARHGGQLPHQTALPLPPRPHPLTHDTQGTSLLLFELCGFYLNCAASI